MTDPRALHAARAAVRYAERWLAYRAWRLQVPGVQWAVRFDGELQGSGAVGVADVVTGEPLTTTHRFRIASHSKTFTSTAVLAAVEQGLLRLDQPIAELLPELADAPSGVGAATVRELLEHGGGVLRDGTDGDFWQLGRPFPEEAELLAAVHDDGGAKLAPGTRFAYSNLGYGLLGAALGRVRGTGYAQAVQDLVVGPLGLQHTAPDLHGVGDAPLAAAHTGRHAALERRRIPHVGTGALAAATGFASTAEDVVTFLAALAPGSGLLLGDAAKRLQQRPLQETGGEGGTRYGLGTIVETVAGRCVVGHSGGYPGHITKSFLDPADGIAVSVLTNAVDGPASELAIGVLTILDAALTVPGRLRLGGAAESADAAGTARFEGRFANLWGVTDVVRLGDRLLALSAGGSAPLDGADVLERVDDTTLRIAEGDGFGSIGETMRYEFASDGAVRRIRGGGGLTSWPFEVDAANAFRPPWPPRS